MKSQLLFLLLLMNSVFAFAQTDGQAVAKQTISAKGQDIPVYDFKGIEPLFHMDNDSTYVLNFWATWCAPCVRELPYFEQLLKKYGSEKLSVKLISLDFINKVEKSLIPFLAKTKLNSEILILDDSDANYWINAIDSSWSGAIPATVIYNQKQRAFFEKSFTFEELETEYLKIKK